MNLVLNKRLIRDDSFWANRPYNVVRPPIRSRGTPCGTVFGAGAMAQGMIAEKVALGHTLAGMPGTWLYGVESFNPEAVADMASADNLAIHIVLGRGPDDVTVNIHNVIHPVMFIGQRRNSMGWRRYFEVARNPDVSFGTLNVPEDAYGAAWDSARTPGPITENVKHDLANGTTFSDLAKWTIYLLERYRAGKLPYHMICCTNFADNGEFTRAVILMMAREWENRGFADAGFSDYIANVVRFPNVMIDRISVGANEKTQQILDSLGIWGPTVVTEQRNYLVIQNHFPNGWRPFADVEGVFYEDDADGVQAWERMKIRTLNAAHSITASAGILLGYGKTYGVYQAMQDPGIRRLVTDLFGLVVPSLKSPNRLDAKTFSDEVLERLDNVNIPDSPWRIAIGMTSKFVRFTGSLIELMDKGVPLERTKPLLFAIAAMLRYCVGVDDEGKEFNFVDHKGESQRFATDSRIDAIHAIADRVRFDDPTASAEFSNFIADSTIMGRNLFELRCHHSGQSAGSAVQGILHEMLKGKGSVRKLLSQSL